MNERIKHKKKIYKHAPYAKALQKMKRETVRQKPMLDEMTVTQ